MAGYTEIGATQMQQRMIHAVAAISGVDLCRAI